MHKRFFSLSMLALLFFGPFIFTVVYFFYGDHSGHAGQQSINKGQLLANPAQLAVFAQGKWQLLLVASPCAQACEAQLDKLNRLRLIFGREMRRIDRVLVTQQAVMFEDEQLNVLYDDELLQLEPGIYIADPRGFVILKYSAAVDPDDIYSDLKHLLKYSHIG